MDWKVKIPDCLKEFAKTHSVRIEVTYIAHEGKLNRVMNVFIRTSCKVIDLDDLTPDEVETKAKAFVDSFTGAEL